MRIIKILLLLVVCLFIHSQLQGQDLLSNKNKHVPEGKKFTLFYTKTGNSPLKTLKPFFTMDYLLDDIFDSLEIQHLTSDDKILIIRTVLNNVNAKKPAMLIIKDYETNSSLNIFFRIFSNQNNTSLIVVTNYNIKSKKLAKNKSEFESCYGILYHIMIGKLVKDNDLHEKGKKSAFDKNLKADLYLFDEIEKNDNEIEQLVKEHIKEEKEPFRNYIGHITLVQYYISVKRYDDALKYLIICERLNRFKKGKRILERCKLIYRVLLLERM